MKRLGVFGGTFDPVHVGHLRCAWEVAGFLRSPVHLVPAGTPVHRDTPGAEAGDRLDLLAAALEGQDRLRLDDREIRRGGPSYMIDTLESLAAEYPDRTLVLVVGSDAFAGLGGWHRWTELFERAHLLVMTRPGPAGELPELLAEFVAGRWVDDLAGLDADRAGRVIRFQVTHLEVSASRVRAELAAGAVPRYLVPEPALRLILERGLYRPAAR